MFVELCQELWISQEPKLRNVVLNLAWSRNLCRLSQIMGVISNI